MKSKIIFSLFFILIFILSSCGQGTAAPASVTQTPTATQPPTALPTQTLLPTPLPNPTVIPYSTASMVDANAVAFIAENALWVANVDGSGERKLTGFAKNDSLGSVQMQWSPNGKWVSYISNEELWLISPDGSTKNEVLSLSDGSLGKLYTYVWSPDSSKIAFENLYSNKKLATPTPGPDSWQTPVLIGIIDLKTGKASVLSTHDSNVPMPLSWSPNGQYIVFAKDFSYIVYEVATRKVIKEIKVEYACWIGWHTWSPNSKWFVHTHYGTGTPWTCLSGLDGSNQEFRVGGSFRIPVWDKTGNFLYIVARTNNPRNDPNIDTNQELLSYDVRTKETKTLFSLTEKASPLEYFWTVSISPDGRTLEMDSTNSENQQSYIFLDLESLATTKFKVSEIPDNHFFNSITYWSADNQNIIFLSKSNGCFYKLDIQTGKTTIISGSHSVDAWVASPIATTP